MNWKTAILTVLLAVVLAIVGTWFYRDSVWKSRIAAAPSQRDTITTIVSVSLPPPVVTPNPAPVVTVRDESMLARVDSLLAVVRDRDSLLSEMLMDKESNQSFVTRKDSAFVVGRIDILYSPIYGEFSTAVTIGSLTVPSRVIEITKYLTTTETDWSLIAIISGFAVALGFVAGISI